jgi:hypothetical protein
VELKLEQGAVLRRLAKRSRSCWIYGVSKKKRRDYRPTKSRLRRNRALSVQCVHRQSLPHPNAPPQALVDNNFRQCERAHRYWANSSHMRKLKYRKNKISHGSVVTTGVCYRRIDPVFQPSAAFDVLGNFNDLLV